MTVQRFPSPAASPVGTITATVAAALLSSPCPPLLIDARSPASHALERVSASLCNPSPHLLADRVALFYDAGSVSLHHAFSTAAAAIAKYARPSTHTPPASLLLVEGGLPALRAAAPHLVVSDPESAASLRRKVKSMPWALRLLDQVAMEAAPPGQVLDWLFVGAAAHAYDGDAMAARGFTHVVVVGGELKARFPGRFVYLHIHARDTASYNLKQHFPGIVAFLDQLARERERGGHVKCLVHCFAGASRSVAAVVSYLVWGKGMTSDHALAFVKERRKAAEPNHGFLKQVNLWEQEVVKGRHRSVKRGEGEMLIPRHAGGEEMDKYDDGEDADDDADDDDDEDDDDEGDLYACVVEEEPLQPREGNHRSTTPRSIPHCVRTHAVMQQRMDFDPSMLPSATTLVHAQQQYRENLKPSQEASGLLQNENTPRTTLTQPFHHRNASVESTVSSNFTLTSPALQPPWTSDFSDIEHSDHGRFMDDTGDESGGFSSS